ncbi:HEAT repeat domain-containing protein [Paenibacillus sp.]|uniref:HEAT repeat domain-containing protein n=1 Tax=Paenibacillus sp. TaxID=58172 RepID=UPI0028127DF8|nr:HEAT repeat domain-containing protein [Paenibacillus sp.]
MDPKQFRFYCQAGNLGMIREVLADLSAASREEYLRSVLQLPLRSDVLEYLGSEVTRLSGEQGTAILIELLYSEEAAARNLAIELFPAFGIASLRVLQSHACDMDPDVRLFVVQAMQQLPYKDEVVRTLAKQLSVEREPNVLVAIVEAIGDMGAGPAEAEAIVGAMEAYDHPYVRFVGERALLRLGWERLAATGGERL